MMKYTLAIILNFYTLFFYAQNNFDVSKYFKQTDVDQASISVTIKELSGNTVVSYNATQALVPASTLKIVTTATALELYGSTYMIPTHVGFDLQDPQHIVVKGYGDPTLGSEYLDVSPSKFLDEWVDQISKHADKRKSVKISVVDDFFGYNGVSDKWLFEDLGNYYASGSYGISIFDNTYRLYLNSVGDRGSLSVVKTVPYIRDLRFENNLQPAITGKSKLMISGLPFSNNRALYGSVPLNRGSIVIKGDVPDPGLLLGDNLAKKLEKKGYKIDKIQTTRKQYLGHLNDNSTYNVPKMNVVYQNNSPSLADIIRIVNVKSNNHYAEHLIRIVGRHENEKIFIDALDAGLNKTASFWRSKGVDLKSMIMYDGSGLAPSNAISTKNLTDILVYMHNKSRYSNEFTASFPRAGKEGTVVNFLRGTSLEGKVLVKSGSIENVQCFAGYCFSGNKKYVFAVMVNNYNSPRKDIVRAIQSILSDYLN